MLKAWIFSLIILVYFISIKGSGINRYNSDFSINNCQDERQPVVEYFSLKKKQYLFFSERVTWDEARIFCRSYNAKLAILNDIEKATAVAEALAESDIGFEDTWLGARRLDTIWTWMDSDEIVWRKNILSIEPDVNNYPPWTRKPTRPTKECLAIDRRSHSYPNFLDLDCRLLKTFICEKKPENSLKTPVPAKWIKVHKSTFILYHAKVTWDEAATFCRKLGARLAILQNQNDISILINSMVKTRPDFETVWIGAHFSYGQWIWMATGAVLDSISQNGYPPWTSGRSQKSEGCLLLDRHIGGNINFIGTKCNRKRDFVCEEYPQDEYDAWLNDPVKFSFGKETYIIYSLERTWQESRDFCKEKGSVLAFMENINTTNVIIEAMGDHPREIVHVWTGGIFHSNERQWRWIYNDRVIPLEKDRFGYPPWANIEDEFDFYNEASTCLNLDRSDHINPNLYGLDCNIKQPFVCKIICSIPPEVSKGNWICEPKSSGNSCQMICDSGFIIIGLQNATCSNHEGWTSSNNWLEFPECLKPSEYADRLVKSIGYEVQKVIGYYFIFDHWNETIRHLSIKFAEHILAIFPINNQLKMGMASHVTNPNFYLHFNQTNHCAALEAIRALEIQINSNRTNHDNSADILLKEISMYKDHKALIVGIIDGNYARKYGNVLRQLISAGHRVIIIGSKEDERALLPLAIVGLNQKVNLYLLDSKEFETVIKEMYKIKAAVTIDCSQLEIPVSEFNQARKEITIVTESVNESVSSTVTVNDSSISDTTIYENHSEKILSDDTEDPINAEAPNNFSDEPDAVPNNYDEKPNKN